MHEVTPKVVAMAVSTVITMFRILLQVSFFIFLVDSFLSYEFLCSVLAKIQLQKCDVKYFGAYSPVISILEGVFSKYIGV